MTNSEIEQALYCAKESAEITLCEECKLYETCDHSTRKDIAQIWIEALEENTKLKDKIEQLKSELEQSIRLPLTNADKIRSMSDEELAEFIQDIWCDNHGYFVDKLLSKSANPICILEMLKREVSE